MGSTYRYNVGQPYTTIQFHNSGSLCDHSSTMSGTYDACRPILSNAAAPLSSTGICTNPTASDCGISDFLTGAVTTMGAVHWIYNDPNAATFFGTPFAGAGRNILRGQPISTANLSFYKDTKVSERLTLQFQATAFNLLNTQFRGVPDPVLDDAGAVPACQPSPFQS